MGVELRLSLDLSHATGSLALHRGPSLLAERDLPGAQTHSEAMLTELEALLSGAAVALPAIDRFVTSLGPGSFTGLRIALASLKAFSLVLDRPIDTMSGGEARARAYARGARAEETQIIAVTRVARGQLACTWLEREGARWVMEPEKVVAGDAVFPYATILSEEKFPLRARYLAETIDEAQTRETFAGLAQLIEAAPRYFAETKYKTVQE